MHYAEDMVGHYDMRTLINVVMGRARAGQARRPRTLSTTAKGTLKRELGFVIRGRKMQQTELEVYQHAGESFVKTSRAAGKQSLYSPSNRHSFVDLLEGCVTEAPAQTRSAAHRPAQR